MKARRILVVAVLPQALLLALIVLPRRGAGQEVIGAPGSAYVPMRNCQARLEARIASLRNKSFEELLADLVNTDGYNWPGYFGEYPHGDKDFETVLTNRLTWRLLELLSSLPRSEAVARTEALCKQMHEQCEAAKDAVIRHDEDPKSPGPPFNVDGTQYGLATAIFFRAHLVGPERIVREFERTRDFTDRIRQKVKRDPRSFSHPFWNSFERVWNLDKSFQINVLAIAAENGSGSDPTQRRRIKDLLSTLDKKTVPITRWDARVSHYDVLHRSFGWPIEEATVTQELVLYTWPIEMVIESTKQDKVVSALWKICESDQ